jgi:hypothetical protein
MSWTIYHSIRKGNKKDKEQIFVDKTPSWEAFHLMVEFADSIANSRITRELNHALEKRHPFSEMPNNFESF